MTDYRIEYRAGIPVVLGDGEGCHPASDAEVDFWRRIAELEHKLRVANDALRLVCATKADPIVRPTHEWGYAKRIAELERENAELRHELEGHAKEWRERWEAMIGNPKRKGAEEEREAIIAMTRDHLDDLNSRKSYVSPDAKLALLRSIDEIQRRAQEGSDV